jgi:hypothetical protein
MSTQAIPSRIALDSSDANRRLRTTVLVAFVVRVIYELYYKSPDLLQHPGGVPYWALGFAPVVALYLIVWRRLADPTSRISIGVALGVGASEAVRGFYPLWLGLSGLTNGISVLVWPQLLLAAVHVALVVMTIPVLRSLKDGRAAAFLGVLLGWYFYTAKMLFETVLISRLLIALH